MIKIEPKTGDTARNATIAPLHDESAIHLFMNRGKKSVVLDLKDERGLEMFYELVEQADVVIDNFRPGVMARLGIDHESLKDRNPDIITSSVTGFGEYGPAKDKAAFDLVVQAYSGHVDITGPADGDPARVGIPIADIAGGIYSCISVLAALVGRELHGKGEHADVAMLDTLVSLLSYDAVDHLNSGRKLTRLGTAHAHMVPWQAFQTSDGYVVVAARDEKFWQNLCDAIGRPDLKDDPRTANNTARVAHRDEVVPILADVFRTRTNAEWLSTLDDYDIPNAPVNDMAQVFSDPQVLARRHGRHLQAPNSWRHTLSAHAHQMERVGAAQRTSPHARAAHHRGPHRKTRSKRDRSARAGGRGRGQDLAGDLTGETCDSGHSCHRDGRATRMESRQRRNGIASSISPV